MSTPDRRGGDRPGEEKHAAGDFMSIPGLGDNKPRPRVLGTSFFGYVPDAFSMKTPDLPSERSYSASAKRQLQIEEEHLEAEKEEFVVSKTIAPSQAVPLDLGFQRKAVFRPRGTYRCVKIFRS